MLVSSFPSYTRGGLMPLAGAPRDLYMQLLACSLSQSVVAIACFLHAILCFGLYVCLFHFWQIRFSIRQLKYIYLQFAPCTMSTDPLLNCLWLQWVLRGVKRSQGSPADRHLPITDSLLSVIHWALDLNIFYHWAFWATCVLGYFGFLRAAEFTVPNLASFSPASHLSVADIAVDLLQSPTCLHVQIKASKMDLFRQGCHIHIGLGRAPLCAVQAFLAYLSLRENVPGPLFLLANGQPLSRSILTDWLRQIFSTAGIEGNFFQPQLAHWGSHGSSSQWYSGPPNSGSWMLA